MSKKQAAEMPSRMPREKALELDNAIMKLQALQMELNERARPLFARRDAIIAEYKLDQHSTVNSETGEISRKKPEA